MSDPCILYTYAFHSDDPQNVRWKHIELPDSSYFATLDEVRAEVIDLLEDKDEVFPEGVPPIQIERIATLPLAKYSLLLLLNEGMEPFITEYEIVEVMV